MNWLGLLVPIAYVVILVGSLATFSSLYRARKLHAITSLEPYFPPHTQRNIYHSLLQLQETDAKVPDSVIRAALLARAVENIKRVLSVRSRKPALQQLLQRGVVGDEIWQRLLRAEQEMELEIKDVVSEANALSNGWGQVIFQSANEMVQNGMLKEKLSAIRSTVEPEKAKWEAQREQSRRELEGQISADDKGIFNKAAAAPATKAASSDEDAVLVETPAAVEEGGGKGKKKKGKK